MPRQPRKANAAPRQRKKTYTRTFYTDQYRKLRVIVLANYPFCQVCNKAFSTETHHLRYGHDITERDLLAVCVPCHKELEREKREGD